MFSFRRICLPALALAALAQGMGCGVPTLTGGAAMDAGVDTRPVEDAGPFDSGRLEMYQDGESPDAGGPCSPVSLASFTPVYNLPVGPFAGACTEDQIRGALGDCMRALSGTGGDKKAKETCLGWITGRDNATCAACLAGPVTAETWSPLLLTSSGEPTVNVAGCIALADPLALECAQSFEYELECDVKACVDACPIAPDDDETAFLNCKDQANDLSVGDGGAGGGCSMFYSQAQSCRANLGDAGSPANFCLGTGVADLTRYLMLACGPSPASADAGARPHREADAGGAGDGY
jgi:hypothetical protein